MNAVPGGEKARATRVLLVRHGQTDWNATGRYHGQADVPLNRTGRAQASALARVLAGQAFDAVVASPLSRARDTARALAAGAPVSVEPRLLEVNVGSWTGLIESEVFSEDPGFEEAKLAGSDYRLSPSGESIAEVAARVSAAIFDAAVKHPGGTVLIVSHGFALQAGLGQLLGWTIAQSRRVQGPFNCAMTELEFLEGRWVMVAHNICHPTVPEQRTGEIKTV